jgi:hypothetical protein
MLLAFYAVLGLVTASASATEYTACDAFAGADQLACISEKYPSVYEETEAACKDASPIRTCRIHEYAQRGITFHPPSKASASKVAGVSTKSAGTSTLKLDHTAAQAASITLTVAGTALSLAPMVCGKNSKCKMTPAQQTALVSFGSVVATQGAQVASVLSGTESDGAKVQKLLTLTQAIFDAAPTGLPPEAQGYVDAALVASRGISAAIIR